VSCTSQEDFSFRFRPKLSLSVLSFFYSNFGRVQLSLFIIDLTLHIIGWAVTETTNRRERTGKLPKTKRTFESPIRIGRKLHSLCSTWVRKGEFVGMQVESAAVNVRE